MTDTLSLVLAVVYGAVFGGGMVLALQPFWRAYRRQRQGDLYAVAAAWFVAQGDAILTSITVSHQRAPNVTLARERYLRRLVASGLDPGLAEPVTTAVKVDE